MPPRSKKTSAGQIEKISVRKLFGFLDYDLPESDPEAKVENLRRIFVLHGLNGTGKTTLLRLTFHLLSPASSAGHKTYLARVPFKLLRLSLSNGIQVTASRRTATVGSLKITVSRPNEKDISVDLVTEDDPPRIPTSGRSRSALLQLTAALSDAAPNFFYLPDDRSLQIELHGLPSLSRKYRLSRTFRRLQRRVRTEAGGDSPGIPIALALEATLSSLSEWLSLEHSKQSASGTASAHTVYFDVIKRLASRSKRGRPKHRPPLSMQLERLEHLHKENETLGRYGLTSTIPLSDVIDLVAAAPPAKRSSISQVLGPYIDGLEARFKELRSLHDKIDTLVLELNSYLTPKEVKFRLEDGIVILAPDGKALEPSMLSSGEKHLVLILSSALLATQAETLFIIDEPEISLNPEWQRSLLGSILKITEGSRVQFLMASHGTALLAQHLDHVVRLEASGKLSP